MERDLFATTGGGGGIARVALPVPVDRLFDYAVPEHLASAARVGCRVRVSAGRRRMGGIIAELADTPTSEAAGKLRPLEAVLDSEPALPARLMQVIREEAQAVLCPVGLALASALPPGSAARSERTLLLTPLGREALKRGALTQRAKEALRQLAAGPAGAAALRRGGWDDALWTDLVRDGLASWGARERGPRARTPEQRFVRLAEGVDVAAACAGALARSPRQAALLRALADGPCESTALARRIKGAAQGVRALRQRGLVRVERREAPLRDVGGLPDDTGRVRLTAEQQQACAEIGQAVQAGRRDVFLLHGVTGSGKTEVYVRAVAEALARGRQALVLVPEITLTHQIVGRLRARFGDPLAVLHSGMRPGERVAHWERLRRGETRIAVGARSALFAPTTDLGVIVLDEEHDGAYKNDEGFRYHARNLAGRRARADGCPVVLGSATPSLETRYAADRGEVRRLRLSHRIGSRPLPAVEIVDLGRERAALPRGRKLILSAALARAMRQAIEDRAQCILFLNRRGFSTQIACFECQHVARCKHCDISLTYHAADQRLRCHYCDYHCPPPEVCPSCGAASTALLGIGTERLEEEVRSHFPAARIARLDRDVARRAGATASILGQLRRGEIDVLVGTQMVAKGHDFPGVRVIGVINADLGLHFPDFRAAERTFQLLTQVAGRAGRGDSPGQVLLQTYSPEHYAIRPVIEHDYERFYREELHQRRALGYPPTGCLGRVLAHAEAEEATREAARLLAAAARAQGAPCEVLGPAPAPIARLRGRHRFQILLKHHDRQAVRRAAIAVMAEAEGLRDVRVNVDLDPLDML